MKNQSSGRCLSFLTALAILCFVSTADAEARTNRNVNRVRPPENTEQFAREAARVRFLNLCSQLGLSDDQMQKMQKIRMKKDDRLKKQNEKLHKAELRYNSEKEKASSEESRIMQQYHSEIEKLLSPEQLLTYRMILRKEAEEAAASKIDHTVPELPDECGGETDGSTGPLIQGPNPPILY